MNHPRIKFCLCVLIIAGLSVLRCAAPSLSGGSSDQGNSMVIGKLVDETGAGAVSAQVRLLPASFNPLTGDSAARIDTTDKNGMYVFTNITTGDYTLEAVQIEKRTRAFVGGIRVAGDTFDVRDKRLEQPGSITIMLPPGLSGAKGYLFIPGTTASVDLKGDNNFATLDSLPPAAGFSIWYTTVNSPEPRILHGNVTVLSGQTTTIFNPEWSHSRKLYLNTTASGAGVSGTVVNFPVLIRLDGNTFDFTQARNGGEDLRFTKPNNSFLQYEIERWDPVGKLAEVWVMVDTVFGNDSAQAITMYWGNPTATSVSNGAAVFDTANGFAAVWHLNTDCSDITTGKHDGTNFGVTDTVGIIGGAKKFDGSSYIQVPGLLGTPQSITLSAWVHFDSTIIFSQDIVSLGDAVALRADRVAAPYYGTQGFFCSKVSASDTVFVFTNTGAFISKTGWRYLTYTVDGARHVQSMYIDGIFQCSTNDINPINFSGLGPNTFLGTHGNKKTQSYAIGCIDEARVCRVARSADWIKLCYMNQKQQDALVRW